MLSSSFPLTAIWCILVPMGKNSVCAERTCKKEKLAVQQGSPKVVPLRTQRTIHPAVPTQAKTGQNQPFLFVRTTLSPVEQQKIVAAYLRGKGIRAISRELDHGREAVARTVKAPEVQELFKMEKSCYWALWLSGSSPSRTHFVTNWTAKWASHWLRLLRSFQPSSRG